MIVIHILAQLSIEMIYLWPSPDMVSCQGQWTLHPWPPFSLCTSGHSVEHSDHAGVLGSKCRLHRLPLYIPSTDSEDKIVYRLSVHSNAPVNHCVKLISHHFFIIQQISLANFSPLGFRGYFWCVQFILVILIFSNCYWYIYSKYIVIDIIRFQTKNSKNTLWYAEDISTRRIMWIISFFLIGYAHLAVVSQNT